MQRQIEPVPTDQPCGTLNSTLASSGHVWFDGETAILEGLGCTLPVGDGSDLTLHPCVDSDQLNSWATSPEAWRLPALSFRAVQLDRESGAFILAGESVHGDQKICFQTTGTAEQVE